MSFPVTSRAGLKFLGNSSASKKEVHELAKENNNCQINEIIRAGNAVGSSPDTLAQAHSEGYDNCHWCIGKSER